MSPSRRTFLRQLSAAAALGAVGQVPARLLWAAQPAELLPEPDEALLRELALAAIDAARAAGATFADIRLGAGRSIGLMCLRSSGGTSTNPQLSRQDGYGIRAIVNGAWGFAGGTELSLDAVVGAARTAVALARANRPRHRTALELAPAPRIENGTWATPIERDPFSVPLEEMRDVAHDALDALPEHRIEWGSVNLGWRCPTTVFASTEGTLVVQRLCQGGEWGDIMARPDQGYQNVAWGSLGRRGGYGYEAVEVATLASRVREEAERIVAISVAASSAQPVEVGRNDIVFGTGYTAPLLAHTLAEAINLERALGYQANSAGTTFAAPPAQMLGKYQVGSELLTVRADRTRQHGAATVGWDEEGVAPEEYTIVRNGVIVDYHTNRQTATELADWYRSQGQPVRSHGCSRRTGRLWPEVLTPNLTLEPGTETTTVDDLIADTRRGFYVQATRSLESPSPDQQVLNTQVQVPHYEVRHIRNGVLGGYVRDFAFQFITPQFWKNVDGLGGADSAEDVQVVTDSSARAATEYLQPFADSTVRAVPIRVRGVNVLNTGRTG